MPQPPLSLHEGEQVISEVITSAWWTWPRYVFTLGLWAIWRERHRWTITNQRLVARKGVIGKSEKALPLERIQDITVHRSPLTGGRVAASTAGVGLGISRIGPLTQEIAREFAEALTIARKASASASRTDGVS